MAPNTKFDKTVAVSADASFDSSNVTGKSVIITGGASGIGEAALRSFVKAGAFVTIGDLDQQRGNAIVSELGEDKVAFVKCNVLIWADQLNLFKTALATSPSKTVDIVLANAGIAKRDDLIEQDKITAEGDPVEPDLSILQINILGVAYTAKLANFYFPRQPEGEDRDRCLVITASLSGYIDHAGNPQYNASKWAVRGFMRSLRRTAPLEGMRVNIIAPWFIHTRIMTNDIAGMIKSAGYEFAEIEDAGTAILHFAADASINGRTFAIVPRSFIKRGYYDLLSDDIRPEEPATHWQQLGEYVKRQDL